MGQPIKFLGLRLPSFINPLAANSKAWMQGYAQNMPEFIQPPHFFQYHHGMDHPDSLCGPAAMANFCTYLLGKKRLASMGYASPFALVKEFVEKANTQPKYLSDGTQNPSAGTTILQLISTLETWLQEHGLVSSVSVYSTIDHADIKKRYSLNPLSHKVLSNLEHPSIAQIGWYQEYFSGEHYRIGGHYVTPTKYDKGKLTFIDSNVPAHHFLQQHHPTLKKTLEEYDEPQSLGLKFKERFENKPQEITGRLELVTTFNQHQV